MIKARASYVRALSIPCSLTDTIRGEFPFTDQLLQQPCGLIEPDLTQLGHFAPHDSATDLYILEDHLLLLQRLKTALAHVGSCGA